MKVNYFSKKFVKLNNLQKFVKLNYLQKIRYIVIFNFFEGYLGKLLENLVLLVKIPWNFVKIFD